MVLRSQLKHPNKQLWVYCLIRFPQLMLLHSKVAYVSQHIVISTHFIQMLLLKNRTSEYCVLNIVLCTQRKIWRIKWKHLGYGKNLLLLLNRVVLIIARKNISSVTYSDHRNRTARTFAEGEYVERLLNWAEVIQVQRERAWISKWKSRLGEAGVNSLSVPGNYRCSGATFSVLFTLPGFRALPTQMLATEGEG